MANEKDLKKLNGTVDKVRDISSGYIGSDNLHYYVYDDDTGKRVPLQPRDYADAVRIDEFYNKKVKNVESNFLVRNMDIITQLAGASNSNLTMGDLIKLAREHGAK